MGAEGEASSVEQLYGEPTLLIIREGPEREPWWAVCSGSVWGREGSQRGGLVADRTGNRMTCSKPKALKGRHMDIQRT